MFHAEENAAYQYVETHVELFDWDILDRARHAAEPGIVEDAIEAAHFFGGVDRSFYLLFLTDFDCDEDRSVAKLVRQVLSAFLLQLVGDRDLGPFFDRVADRRLPIPLAPPVTTATLLSNSAISLSPCLTNLPFLARWCA